MDCGEDLRASPAGPWLDDAQSWKANFHTHFLPTSLHRPNIALQPLLWKDNYSPNKKRSRGTQKMTQSASRLHLRYGRFLNSDVMSRNPFYALHELFAVVASAELQFLDMMTENLEKDLGGSLNDADIDPDNEEVNLTSQSNLLRGRSLLEEHIQDLNEVLNFFKHKGEMITWSQSLQQETSQTADAAANDLQQDFQYLLDRAETLRLRCERAMTIAMNGASIAEARRGILQGKSLFKFTVLASLYVPLSFTTSFFGMNIVQFGNGNVNIWIFFVVTLPIFGVSALFLFYDWQKLHRLYRKYVIG
jgi:Mg2+ and Co2+ transporter CorA